METAVIIPVWKRPAITKTCFENLAKTDLKVYCGTSEDWCFRLCDKYGFTAIDVQNRPFGHKKNKTIYEACRGSWDQIMELGTDNLLDLSQLDEYLSHGYDFYGKQSCYITEPSSSRAKIFGYDVHRTLGAGRVLSRKAVETTFPLWDMEQRKGMDTTARNRLKNNGFKETIIEGDPITAGMKSEVNINHYDDIGGEPVKYDSVAERFPELKSIEWSKIL